MPGPTLQLCSVTQRFERVVAVDELTLSIGPGKLHAIIGENGAGKSTALKLLCGQLRPTSGRVLVDGQPLRPATAHEGIRRGIGMVHQHFMLVEHFTALENLVIGCEPVDRFRRVDFATARARAQRIAEQLGVALDLNQPVAELTVGQRQKLEILRVLFRGARAILLDEPTAVLSPSGVAQLYGTLRQLTAQGRTVVVVTHRLDEVTRYCDAVAVMRRGRLVMEKDLSSPTPAADAGSVGDWLTRAIMGSEPPPPPRRPPLPRTAAVALTLSDLTVARVGRRRDRRQADRSSPDALVGFELELRRGEIVGVAGVEGNGQRALSRVLTGLEPLRRGRIVLAGQTLFAAEGERSPVPGPAAVREAQQRGLVVVHEDRHRDEMVLPATVADNLILGDLGQVDEVQAVRRRFAKFDVHPPDPDRLAAELSGGNQQKVVTARALDRKLSVLVLCQPTRGVDVAAARAIHQAIVEAAAAGAAVLLISADLSELKRLSHRLIVLRRGRIAAELEPDASDESIGRAMLGTEAA